MTTSALIALLANLAIALSFLVGLIFGIVQVQAVKRDRRERLTLETLRSFQSREFVDLMQYVNRHDLPVSGAAMRGLPMGEQNMLVQLGQEMESLGILVAERFVSIDLVDKTLGSFVTGAWAKYKVMIEELRVSTADPFLSEYFQWLAECLDRRMRERPRRPFHEVGAHI